MLKKRLKWHITPGLVCTIDPKNTLKQDTTGVEEVIIIGRKKRRWFKYDLWEVRDASYQPGTSDKAPSFIIPENYLLPSGMTIIRFPADIPTFNDLDVAVVQKIIDGLDPANGSKLTISTKDYDRLKALKEKMLFTIKMREV